MANWPKVNYKEEGLRKGMQIEDSQISVDDKVSCWTPSLRPA